MGREGRGEVLSSGVPTRLAMGDSVKGIWETTESSESEARRGIGEGARRETGEGVEEEVVDLGAVRERPEGFDADSSVSAASA